MSSSLIKCDIRLDMRKVVAILGGDIEVGSRRHLARDIAGTVNKELIRAVPVGLTEAASLHLSPEPQSMRGSGAPVARRSVGGPTDAYVLDFFVCSASCWA